MEILNSTNSAESYHFINSSSFGVSWGCVLSSRTQSSTQTTDHEEFVENTKIKQLGSKIESNFDKNPRFIQLKLYRDVIYADRGELLVHECAGIYAHI